MIYRLTTQDGETHRFDTPSDLVAWIDADTAGTLDIHHGVTRLYVDGSFDIEAARTPDGPGVGLGWLDIVAAVSSGHGHLDLLRRCAAALSETIEGDAA